MLNVDYNINKSQNSSVNNSHVYRSLLASLSNFAVYNLINSNIKSEIFRQILKDSFTNSEKYNAEYKKAIDKSYRFSGLKDKGIKIIDASKVNDKEIFNIIKKDIPLYYKFTKNNYKKALIIINNMTKQIKAGKNGIFVKNDNTIIVNFEKRSITFFHELGHSANKFSYICKFLQKIRGGISKFTYPIFLITAIFPKDNNKNANLPYKIIDFIANNCVLLTMLSVAPTIIEESIATLNGLKFAKPFLNNKIFKKLCAHNLRLLSCYYTSAILTLLSMKIISLTKKYIESNR